MTRKESLIVDWLLKNNVLYSTLNEHTDYKLCKKELEQMQMEEMKNVFHMGYSRDLHSIVYPLFSGDVCYLENAAFIDKDTIKQSRINLKEWFLNHIVSVSKKGICISKYSNNDDKEIRDEVNGNEYEYSNIHFPELPYTGFSDKHKYRNCDIHLIKDCNVYSSIYIKPNSLSTAYENDVPLLNGYISYINGDSTVVFKERKKKSKENKLSLLNENKELRYKIKECQDLYVDMDNMCFQPMINFSSFKNFPDIVHGNFVMINWDNIISFDGFPMHCKREVLFKNCRIPYDVVLPNDVTIDKNLVCMDCTNDYNLLMGILKYNWNIKGKIYTSLYTGSLEYLRILATDQKWI